MKKSYTHISRYFFLILFLAFFAGNTFFDHSHLYHGNIIVHSHPFKKGQDGNPIHSHSDSAYQLIYLLNHYLAGIVLSCTLATGVFFLLKEIAPLTVTRFHTRTDQASILLRGPPSRLSN
ncbi:MAG: hypothetical protein V2B15_05845 [Bacteroidota bacterium]